MEKHLQPLIPHIYERYVKRLLDIALVLVLLPISLPIIAILWTLCWLEGGQGFYKDTRVGRNGIHFQCWKLRTMRPQIKRRCAAQKTPFDQDLRISAFGRVLRKTSLDELPQLWNVLKGDMSMVGPRPVPLEELSLYGPARHAYLGVRPGLTGLWQISGRNSIPYEERIALDRSYASSLGVFTDLKAIARTFRELLRMRGI